MNDDAITFAGEVIESISGFTMDALGAALLIIAGWVVAGWVYRTTRRWMDRWERVDPTLKPLMASIARYAVLVLTLIAVLAQFGVETTSIIAVLGAAGLAVGLALQGTLSNIAAGMMLLFLRPFQVGDYIDADGIAGTVNEIGLFTSQLTTFDGVYVSVPNAQLWNRQIKNFSRLPTRRIDVTVGISYDDDIDRAMAALKSVLDADDRILPDPESQVMVNGLADSSVNINMRCWTEAGNYWSLLFDLHKNAKQKLDAEGISIPFPQRDIHIRTGAEPITAARKTSGGSRKTTKAA